MLLFNACNDFSSSEKVLHIDLNNDWYFSQNNSDQWYVAQVPGCVHTDLFNNNLIPDPYFGINENFLQSIGKSNWTYKKTFSLDSLVLNKEELYLVFEGLDTYADVYLNGNLILSANNMFRTWKVRCNNLLKINNNELIVKFKSVFAVDIPKWQKAKYRLKACDNNDQADTMISMYARKAPFHYGWDWGPRFITYGIWKPVYIEAWNYAKINDIRITNNEINNTTASLNANVEIEASQNCNIEIDITINKKHYRKSQLIYKGNNIVSVPLKIDNPILWWTNNLGGQYLYTIKTDLRKDKVLIDSKIFEYGIRDLKIVREKDSLGTSFYVKLNGIPVFMKGANYIPQDNFQNRVTSDKYENIIKAAVEANMNMLRVWGGGIYENDIFYDLCDKYGILVWQDLMFACSMYPNDTDFYQNIKHEIIDNVKRLRNHPSIALWCGNNECEAGWESWGWKNDLSVNEQNEYFENYNKLFYELIPHTIDSLDERYYHFGSPNTGFNNIEINNGDNHYWGVWHGNASFSQFKNNIGRFVSEYGFQALPEISSIKKFTNPLDRNIKSIIMLNHQRCMADKRKDKSYGYKIIEKYMINEYGIIPEDFNQYIYLSQILQAKALKTAIESHRLNMGYCMGTLYWQLNDCWPVVSWSSIDYYGKWKASHFQVKKSYNPFLIVFNDEKDSIKLYVVSDNLKKIDASLQIKILDFNGKIIWNNSENIFIEPLRTTLKYIIPKNEILSKVELNKVFLYAEAINDNKIIASNSYFFVSDKELDLPQVEIFKELKKADFGYILILRSTKLIRNVMIKIENIDYQLSDNYFDLLPDMPVNINIFTKATQEKVGENIEFFTLNELKRLK
jgi:beta-mannosidase